MNDGVAELYRYDLIRQLESASALCPQVTAPTIVLGSTQRRELLRGDVQERFELRRRRGGGGAVLLCRGDAWLDVWIPRDDPLYVDDVRAQAVAVGEWWLAALTNSGLTELTLITDNGALRPSAICFGSLGAGEIARNGHKIVGLTQWRVREGAFISTTVPSDSSDPLVNELADPPADASSTLQHATLHSVGLFDRRQELLDAVVSHGGLKKVTTIPLT